MVADGADLGAVLPVLGALRGRSFFLVTSRTHIHVRWQGATGVGTGEAQWFWLLGSPLWHPMCLCVLLDSADFRRRDLRGPTPVGAPLELVCRNTFRLLHTMTLSSTLLSFEFIQCPQHVLSYLLDRPHTSVLARSATVAFSSAFSLALSLAFTTISALRLPIRNPLLFGLLLRLGGEVGFLVRLIYLALTMVMCMVVPLDLADPAPAVLRCVLPE